MIWKGKLNLNCNNSFWAFHVWKKKEWSWFFCQKIIFSKFRTILDWLEIWILKRISISTWIVSIFNFSKKFNKNKRKIKFFENAGFWFFFFLLTPGGFVWTSFRSVINLNAAWEFPGFLTDIVLFLDRNLLLVFQNVTKKSDLFGEDFSFERKKKVSLCLLDN